MDAPIARSGDLGKRLLRLCRVRADMRKNCMKDPGFLEIRLVWPGGGGFVFQD
jgi:hypothetical protein